MIVCIYVHVYLLCVCVCIYIYICVCARACYIKCACWTTNYPSLYLFILFVHVFTEETGQVGPATQHPKSPAGPKKPTGLSITHCSSCSSSPIKPGWGSGIATNSAIWQPKIIMSIHSKEWNGVSLCNIIIHIYIYIFIYLFIYLFIYIYLFIFIYLFIYLFICLFIYLYNIQFILCCLAIPSCCWTPGVVCSQNRKKKTGQLRKASIWHVPWPSKILQMLPKGWLEMISETLVASSRSLVVSGLKKC